MLNEDIWHLGGGGEIGTGIGLVMVIDAVGGNGNGLRGDRNRRGRLWPPVVGTRRMVWRVKVRGGRGNRDRKGRQVGQFEGFLFCTEGSVNGMGGRFFTVISILRGYVCRYGYGRIVRSRGGRVTHASSSNRPTKRLWAITLSIPLFPRQWRLHCLHLLGHDNPLFLF